MTVGLGVALLLAACSSAPSDVQPDASAAPPASTASSAPPQESVPATADLVVAIGDSFAAGVGARAAEGPCGRSDYGWTAQVARDLGRPFVNLACGGAVLEDIDAQIDQIPPTATLVLMSGGGNDAGAAALIRGCRTGDCIAAADAYIAKLPEVTRRLVAVMRRAGADGRRVVLISYAVGATGACDEHAPEGFAAIEKATYEAVGKMRAAVDTVRAEGFDVLFAGAPPFVGRDICDVGEPWSHGRASMLYLHPNDRGHQELARLVGEVLR